MTTEKAMIVGVLAIFLIGSYGMFSVMNSGTGSNGQRESSSHDMSDGMGYDKDDVNRGMGTIKLSEAVGKVAPDFTLTKRDGSEFKLSDHKDKTVVLFFSGGAMCYPSCWNQIESLGSDARFNNDNVLAASVVVDTKKEWDDIIESQPKYGSATLLFDTNKTVSRAYGMLNAPSSMHEGSSPGHTYLIIKEGVISYMLDDPRMALNTDEIASKL